MLAESNSRKIGCKGSSRGSSGYSHYHLKSLEKINMKPAISTKRMGSSGIYPIKSCQKRNMVVASRSLPILFIVVCFLVNTMCDEVGSANELVKDFKVESRDLESAILGAETKPSTKFDPLSILREIYLDQGSKIITLLSPSNMDTVQKFHTNGRYGRRSVSSLIGEPSAARTEWGKLRLSDDGTNKPLESLLGNSFSRNPSNLRRADGLKNKALQSSGATMDDGWLIDPEMNELELNKLLKCNYTGVTNLYWCDTGN